MTHHMIGKVLQARYQIVQSLGAGVFGQTYIAVDIEYPENPKCVVKQLKVSSSHPSYLDNLRLRFLTETETLKRLGRHAQIPQLIACFEENERFYLVQEFIEGHALTEELPINKQCGDIWSESQVIAFLEDVLGILEFVHAQGVIHCDIKPENLIRRAYDGRLVLIDFGSIQPFDFGADSELPIHSVPVTSLGYIPPEQFIGQTQPNSDIYSLGIIAIQALTGLSPLQFKLDPYTNEIIWHSPQIAVNDYLAAILSQMIRYDFQDRFQSASEVLHILQEMLWETHLPPVEEQHGLYLEPSVTVSHLPQSSATKKSAPLLTGMRIGIAANSMLLGLGMYSLFTNSPAYSETETLYKATEEYQAGDLQEAIALVKSIPSDSKIYPEAQATIDEWQQQWQVAAEQYQFAETAFNAGRWSDVLSVAAKVPDILYWQSKTDKLVEQARTHVEAQTQDLLAKAYASANNREFSTAIEYLRQVPVESSAGVIVQKKLAEYDQKQKVRATFFLQKAYNKASAGEFEDAVKFLQKVPKNTPVYAQARIKLNEYTQKQRLRSQTNSVALSKQNSAVKKPNSDSRYYSNRKIEKLRPIIDIEGMSIQ
ncbi:MAG: protein kinase domain-containing protein [Aulosira sp. ZfuVER01]|nr:serine/threonine-protein kinase [Aulosira sp. ZfuVER01]MDZ8002053.1 serine/threonine-protein kinase [Aulosira sp. DedVER01a]MDZ8056273.1 serine/threonine-protein kinase [Aulosira sp. ZfuCHP01]